MYGLIGRMDFNGPALVNGANDTKSSWGMTVDPYDTQAYLLGSYISLKGGKFTPPPTLADFCKELNSQLARPALTGSLLEGDGKGGANDLGTCLPCTTKTSEVRHGGSNTPRLRP